MAAVGGKGGGGGGRRPWGTPFAALEVSTVWGVRYWRSPYTGEGGT